MTILATPVSIERPVYALTALHSFLSTQSSAVAESLMRAGIKPLNTRTTRSVFTAPFDKESEECSFADSDICLSYFLHLAQDDELRREVFDENPRTIVDRNVLVISNKEFHIAFRVEEQGGVELLLIPRLDPDQLEHFQFVRVHAAC
jgi:hypothetical protein